MLLKREREREAKKGDSIKVCGSNLLSVRQNAQAQRQQRRVEQRANCKLMQMISTSLSSMVAALATGDKAANAVIRLGQQQPAVKGLQEEQVKALQEEDKCTPPKQPCQCICTPHQPPALTINCCAQHWSNKWQCGSCQHKHAHVCDARLMHAML